MSAELATTATRRHTHPDDPTAFAAVLRVIDAACFPAPDPFALWRVERLLTFGRSEGPGQVTIDDPHVSRRHAAIRPSATGWVLEDLGSRNGTLLNGQPVEAPTALSHGDLVEVGPSTYAFVIARPSDLDALAEDNRSPFGPVPTRAITMARVLATLRRLAATDVEILLGGETGVGKEVYAEAIHRESKRPGPFVAVNCAALPEPLLESELFGYKKGAHSAASEPKPGLVEKAAGGTLFLDEIGDMSLAAQAKLLRFLQTREFYPLGGTAPKHADVRVLAASRFGVSDAAGGPGVRADLAARLGPKPIVLPPLAERREDIGQLAGFFLRRLGRSIAPAAQRLLLRHRWPGNVRELERALGSAAVLAPSPDVPIGVAELEAVLPDGSGARDPSSASNPPAKGAPARHLPGETPDRDELARLLAQHRGNVPSVARALGRNRTLVWRWVRKHGLSPEDYQSG